MATSIFILTGVALGLWAWVLVVPVVVIRVRSLHVRGALGLALPGFILMTGAGWSEGVLRHELEHQRQMRRYSPWGAALILGWHYGRGSIRELVQHGRLPPFWSLWASCPLERAANAAMTRRDPLPRHIVWAP